MFKVARKIRVPLSVRLGVLNGLRDRFKRGDFIPYVPPVVTMKILMKS